MAKTRIPIPPDTATDIMFDSDRTCCVCNEPGKPTQIHHIDENPSNNDPSNLAVLCLFCHDETQVKGGFGRKLNAEQVARYRDEWLVRVKQRRKLADQLTASSRADLAHTTSPTAPEPQMLETRECLPDPKKVENYVRTLPAILQSVYARAKPDFDTGVTVKVTSAASDIIDVLEQILVALVRFYPNHHFGGHEPDVYVNTLVSSRYTWHRGLLEPNGYGTGGTMIRPMVYASVMNDLEQMISDMVSSLHEHLENFDFKAWNEAWKKSTL